VKKLFKYLALALTLMFFAAIFLALWLRHEFTRVSIDYDQAAWAATAVAPLDGAAKRQTPCDQQYPLRRAFFGALHVHTAASYDATAFGTTNTADDAYRFARGEPVELRLHGDLNNYRPPALRISSPLDFMAITDHAEAMGENRLCYKEDSASYGLLVCRLFRGDIRLPVDEGLQPLVRLASQAVFGQDRSARVCGADASRCKKAATQAWRDNQASTERWGDGSSNCEFSTFHAYEYSLAEEASNLHRNVIFKSDTVPQTPLSARDARKPEQLWRWLDEVCIAGNTHCDALTIPHNSNWSNGRMWSPISASDLPLQQKTQLAALRSRLEPLAEIMQVKGDSECRNGIASVMGAPDELCDFEKLRPAQEAISDCGDGFGSGGMMLKGCTSRNSYVRYALSTGLSEEQKLGVNPFKLGIVAASDTHNAVPAVELEKGHLGSHGADRNIQQRLQGEKQVPGGIATGSPVRYNPGGIAGVYARENSRAALFEAMQQRETFGTSGPRIEPRFFAGWRVDANICKTPDYLVQAYRNGVPMGSDLPPRPAAAASPVFIASASADPRSGLLQRVQIIKGWVDDEGRTHQAVYDVAGDGDNGATVDPGSCAVSGPGSKQLCNTWQDPQFDPTVPAVYYARVLENPSCRWSHHDCLSLPEEERPASCSDPDLPWQIQERAWTSPIWYRPEAEN
jgi:hypothetical protein